MNTEIQKLDHKITVVSWSGDIFDEPYYRYNKRILSLIGQWPYQLRRERTFKFWFIMILGSSGLITQMRALIIGWGELDRFVASFAPLVTNIACLCMLTNSNYYIPKMKKILDETRMNWEYMRNLPNLRILQEHGDIGKLFTLFYTSVSYVVIFAWILTPLVPRLMDAVAPLNHTRASIEMIPADYMLDPEKYFWPIFFHLGTGIIVILTVLLAIDTFYMALAQHAVGMFEILRYDLENILQDNETMTYVALHPDYHADVFFHNIVSCIKRHKKLLEYVHDIESTCSWNLLITVGISVLVLSFTGYQTVCPTTAKEDVLRMGAFTFAQTYHLFCISLPSHWLSSESSLIPDSAYSCRWYMMSVRSRKLILLLLRATLEPCKITAGKIYVMSLENFCGVLQMSMSYLAMLTSLQ